MKSIKMPITPSGIEGATFQFVAQCLPIYARFMRAGDHCFRPVAVVSAGICVEIFVLIRIESFYTTPGTTRYVKSEGTCI
jgi:hypothetical protein